ncbi:LuxR C-terminal-related transcriptional regulator [Kribbella sp. NPDC055071]
MKQVVPPVRAGALAREQLIGKLQETDARLALIVAPVGWGKTSLVSAWAARAKEERLVAWVSLDETDDEPNRFWRYVLSALRASGSELGEAALDALDAVDLAPVDLALPLLLNELADSTHRHVLVLDDYHSLTDSRIHESVEYLINYLPPTFQLVLASRRDPPLPLARMRARGQLEEIRAEQLSFTSLETAQLVSAVAGVDLSTEAASELWARTEGWAAGLQLAALALRGTPDPELAAHTVRGDDRSLLDFFSSEVLPALAPEQRDLLRRAAPLEALSGPLCDAALDTNGSADVLADLERAGLFVSSLDERHEWYRCHRLLRDVLLGASTCDADSSEVLARAGEWFAVQGRIDDAARHLIRAGHGGAAADLLLAHAQLRFFDRGLAPTYLRLGDDLPPEVVSTELAISLATAAFMAGARDEVDPWLDTAESRIRADTVVSGWSDPRAATLARRASWGFPDSASARSVEQASRAVELESPDGDGLVKARMVLGSAMIRDGRFKEGVTILLESWRDPERVGWPAWVQLQMAGLLGVSLLDLGRSPEFDVVRDQARPLADEAERDWGQAGPLIGTLFRVCEGRRAYLGGDVAMSKAILDEMAARVGLHARPTLGVLHLIYLADTELAAGDRDGARAALVRARELVEEEQVSQFVIDRLSAAEARMGRRAVRAASREGALVQELTDREHSILRAMQGSATQREIGAELYLSINTVKAYTKILYRKLGVATRQDAVDAARQLGLI